MRLPSTRLGVYFTLVAVLPSCLDTPPIPSREDGVQWFIEPSPDAGVAPSSLRIHLELDATADDASLALFRGELSEYHHGRIRRGELPDTLEERRVPTIVFRTDERSHVLAPTTRLAPDVYGIAQLGMGVIGTFHVGDAPDEPFFDRVWPPRADTPAPEAVFCGAPRLTPELRDEPVSILPPESARASAGVDRWGTLSDRCIRLEVAEGAAEPSPRVPPPRVAEVLLDTEPLLFGRGPRSVAVACVDPEVPFGAGCATVLDDRLIVRTPAESTFWTLRPADGRMAPFFLVADRADRVALTGLSPRTSFTFDVEVRDLHGTVWTSEVRGETATARPHLVINEVLANPRGSEPGQEWVELLNDGSVSVDLESFLFGDSAVMLPLPAHVVPPGAFVVLVPNSYQRDAELDVTPPDASVLIRLPALGKAGISNGGETLWLRDAAGQPLSRFPARASTKAGVSVARRAPWTLDDDPAGFGEHASPGASPGAPNELDSDAD